MGCNTSAAVNNKEGESKPETNGEVPAQEYKDNDANAEEDEEGIVESPAENKDADDEIEELDEKSTSAKTVTLKSTRPNSESSVRAELGSDAAPETTVTIEQQQTEADFLDVEEALAEELAATKIQAVFRGHQTRRNMKQADNPVDAEPSKEQLEAEFRADDEELCHAATKIQASFRGHMARKTKDGEGDKPGEGEGEPAHNANEEEEIDIDLADPEVSKAAVKIQASFRGHMARKEQK